MILQLTLCQFSAIAVTGSVAGSPTRDVDITGSIRATEIYEGSNRLTYNIGGGTTISGTVANDRLPASINVTDLSATTSLIKTSGLKFDSILTVLVLVLQCLELA